MNVIINLSDKIFHSDNNNLVVNMIGNKRRTSIRRSCFETNSSSMHSIVVTENDIHIPIDNAYNHVYVGNNGEISLPYEIEYGYGRGFQPLSSFADKLSYALCEYLGYASEEEKPAILDEFREICRIHVENFSDFDMDQLDDIGWIDHQSAGRLKSFIRDHKISLEEFLTNEKYQIIVDGDEYCYFDEMIKSGLIDMKYIKEIY